MTKQKYIGNMQIRELTQEESKKLNAAKVLVTGHGKLSSTVIANLTDATVGTLGLMDSVRNDNTTDLFKPKSIEAKLWIKKQNPVINVIAYTNSLTEEELVNVINDYDIVIDCLESYKEKFLLNKVCVENNKPLIHSGIYKTYGQLTTIIPHETACLNCLFNEEDLKSYISKEEFCPAADAIGALLSQTVVNLILNQKDTLKNILLTYDSDSMDLKQINITPRKDCKICKK